jgi:hypothetical protein
MSEQVWVALIAAGAAIVASIGAQIIGAVVSHKQEKRRLDLEERKLFIDTRRVAFVNYLQTRRSFAKDIFEIYIGSDGPEISKEEKAQIREQAFAHESQLEPLSNEISLLAPEVAKMMEREKFAISPLWEIHVAADERAAAVQWFVAYNDTTFEIEKAMRKSLGIETAAHTRRQLKSPRMLKRPEPLIAEGQASYESEGPYASSPDFGPN